MAVIEPGAIQSEWADIAADHLQELRRTVLTKRMERVRGGHFKGCGKFSSKPKVIARLVDQAALSRRPKTRYWPVQGANLVGSTILSDKTIDRLWQVVGKAAEQITRNVENR